MDNQNYIQNPVVTRVSQHQAIQGNPIGQYVNSSPRVGISLSQGQNQSPQQLYVTNSPQRVILQQGNQEYVQSQYVNSPQRVLVAQVGQEQVQQQVIREVVQETKYVQVPVTENKVVERVVNVPVQKQQLVQVVQEPPKVLVQEKIENNDLKKRPTPEPQVIEKKVYIEDTAKINELEQVINQLQDQLNKQPEPEPAQDPEKVKRTKNPGQDDEPDPKIKEQEQEIENLQNQIREWENRYQQLEIQSQDYQIKIAQLAQEIERLNLLLQQKQQELLSLQSSYYEMQQQTTQMTIYETQINEYQIQISALTQQYEEVMNELIMWRTKYAEVSTLGTKINELMTVIVVANIEIEGLRKRLNEGTQQQSLRSSITASPIRTSTQQVVYSVKTTGSQQIGGFNTTSALTNSQTLRSSQNMNF